MAGPSGGNKNNNHGPQHLTPQQRDSHALLEHAAKTAEQFAALYYAASDSKSRSSLIPTLYAGNATVVWNGNPTEGQAGIRSLLDAMPATRYEVQSLDCQPVGGSSRAGAGNEASSSKAPSLMLTVGGVVTHHTSTSYTAMPPSNAPSSSSNSGGGTNNKRKSAANRANQNANPNAFDPSLPLDSLPRAFSQNFVLVDLKAEVNEGGVVAGGGGGAGSSGIQARYFVLADNFRFVG